MDEERAEALVNRYADMLLRIGCTWCGNAEDAQDMCQTVLLKLLEDGRTFPDPGQERAWVIRLAVNACKNIRRSAWRRRTVALDPEALGAVELPDPEEDGIFRLVQRLPLKYRRVIYLRYYEEYGVGEIAQILGIKPALVSTHLARARARLKAMLEGSQDENRIPE